MPKVSHATGSDPFLEMIETRMAALRQLRSSYLSARAAGAIGPFTELPPPVPARPGRSVPEAPDGGGARTSITARVEGLLDGTASPMKPRDIAAVLRRSGLAGPAATTQPTIQSILHRLRQRGKAVRTARGWLSTRSVTTPVTPIDPPVSVLDATAAAAPVRIDAPAPPPAAAADASPPVVRVPARRPRRPRQPSRPASGPTPDRQPGGLAWKIESLLRSHGQPVAARYVSEATGVPLNVVGLALGRMVRQQRIEKQPDGHFMVVLRAPDETTHSEAETDPV